MIRKNIILISILVFSGCLHQKAILSSGDPIHNTEVINKQKGLAKNEAILIAQDYVLKNPPEGFELNIARARVYPINQKKDGFIQRNYSVHFPIKNASFLYPFYWSVLIDQSSGQILQSKLGSNK